MDGHAPKSGLDSRTGYMDPNPKKQELRLKSMSTKRIKEQVNKGDETL